MRNRKGLAPLQDRFRVLISQTTSQLLYDYFKVLNLTVILLKSDNSNEIRNSLVYLVASVILGHHKENQRERNSAAKC